MGESRGKNSFHTNLPEELLDFDRCIYPLLMQDDLKAWDEFYDHYSNRLCFYFGRKGVEKKDQEDLVQQTMVVIFRRLSAYNPDLAPFRSWIYGIANRVCISYLSDQSALLSIEKTGDEDLDRAALEAGNPFEKEETSIDDPRLPKLKKALETLPVKDQEILKLKVSRTGTWDDLAQELKLGVSAVKMRYFRALDKLEEAMKVTTTED